MTGPGELVATSVTDSPGWWVYQGTGVPGDLDAAGRIPPPPPWRDFRGEPIQPPPPTNEHQTDRKLGVATDRPRRSPKRECDLVNAALLLRRPLLVTGGPGTGKSSLAYRIARELHLGRVLHWPITSRMTLRGGLYEYDAIGRAQAAAARRGGAYDAEPDLGEFIRLGPLGTALLAYDRPRVLLIDELDKSDVDLPNDLLHIFEDGDFGIAELIRARSRHPEVTVFTDDPDRTAVIHDGRVRCRAFPIVVITSNGEREFPPAFLRRCLRLEVAAPDADDLAAMVHAHLGGADGRIGDLIQRFLGRMERDALARDQLLNAVYLTANGTYGMTDPGWQELIAAIWHPLSAGS
jgi:MoxR-like ATPase